MSKGWDLQVALYAAMLEKPTYKNDLTCLQSKGATPVTAYHTMLDHTVLVDEIGEGIPGTDCAGDATSTNAMDHLALVLDQVGSGVVELNCADEQKRFPKERGITAYPLQDNVLVQAFLMPETVGDSDE